MLVIVNPSAYAILALTATNYIFKPFFPDCPLPFLAHKLFSIWIVGRCSMYDKMDVLRHHPAFRKCVSVGDIQFCIIGHGLATAACMTQL